MLIQLPNVFLLEVLIHRCLNYLVASLQKITVKHANT